MNDRAKIAEAVAWVRKLADEGEPVPEGGRVPDAFKQAVAAFAEVVLERIAPDV